ncbi:MAG: thiamine pyrophosphate-dependent dehydrogenase E1 component subunit alpha [Actinobacteria bacterium]|nr:thiamine pyrophosphate-dependent dehydrogenase E1 component subunit alpha [Actinomycetota bacterium]
MTPKLERQYPKDLLLSLYRSMKVIREFEEKVYFLFLQGIMPGTIHQYQGQEAVAVGVCAHLRKEDYILSTHRPHGHALAKGIPPRSAMAELFAKAEGCSSGKGGSMHMGDPDYGMLTAIAIVGGGFTITAGLALAYKYQKKDNVATYFFGDGAANEGAFHEALNFASVHDLPCVFICENNLYAASTPFKLTFKIKNIADRAASYGMRGDIVDGQDVIAVYEHAGEAIKLARAGKGPTLLEAKTYRFIGHSRSDPSHYRPKEELEEYKKNKDPLEILIKRMLTLGINKEEIAKIDSEVKSEIEESVNYAQSLPEIDTNLALKDVFVE